MHKAHAHTVHGHEGLRQTLDGHGLVGKPHASTDSDHDPAHMHEAHANTGHAHNDPLPAHGVEQLDIDIKHTARLKKIIDEYGWPMDSMVRCEGGLVAFLLAQHADLDPVFQRRYLERMKIAPEGQVSKVDVAYLTDRVLVNEGKKQLFGTQSWMVEGKLVPQPIADEAIWKNDGTVLG